MILLVRSALVSKFGVAGGAFNVHVVLDMWGNTPEDGDGRHLSAFLIVYEYFWHHFMIRFLEVRSSILSTNYMCLGMPDLVPRELLLVRRHQNLYCSYL